MFFVGRLVLDRQVNTDWKSTGFMGTRTVPVPGNGGPNMKGARTRTVPVPGGGGPNIQGTRTERFLYPSVI